MAFRGTFDYSLDAKNRLTIPAKFRASLSEGVVLAKGIERCVQVWTPHGFEAYTGSALQDIHPLSDQARVAAAAEGAVDGDLAGLRVEQLDELAGQHGDVRLRHVKKQSGHRGGPICR